MPVKLRIPGAKVSSPGPAAGAGSAWGGWEPGTPRQRSLEGPGAGVMLPSSRASPWESRCRPSALGMDGPRAPLHHWLRVCSGDRAPTTVWSFAGGSGTRSPNPSSPGTVSKAVSEGDGGCSADAPTSVPARPPSPALALSAASRCAGVCRGGNIWRGAGAVPMAQMWRARRPRTQAALSAASDPRP